MRPAVLLACLLVACLTHGTQTTVAADSEAKLPKTAGTRSEPLSIPDSLAAIHVGDDVIVECIAHEPAVVDPVAIAWDAKGDLYAVEMRDYPLGPAEGEAPRSRIVRLIDADDDGKYESSEVFADGLLFATGLLPWKDGFIVTTSGEVQYLKDTTGDGKADLKEVWYRGFAEENSQLRANHPTLGPDFRVYIANGLRGGTIVPTGEGITKDVDKTPIPLSRSDFAFDPLTGEAEAVSGNGQFGLCFDKTGQRFVCDNRHPCRQVMLPKNARHPDSKYIPKEVMHDVLPAGAESKLYPRVDAWTTSNLHANQFTAACGLVIDRNRTHLDFGPDWDQTAFVCEPTASLVHRADMRRFSIDSYSRTMTQEPPEFLASSDAWFRPVNLAFGPDGCLYVCDIHRAVIEHPRWMPTELKNRPDLRWGDKAGRLYKIRVWRKQDSDAFPQLATASNAELISVLQHPLAWVRLTAARLLLERGNDEIVRLLDRSIFAGTHGGLVRDRRTAIRVRDRLQPFTRNALLRLDLRGWAPTTEHLRIVHDRGVAPTREEARRFAVFFRDDPVTTTLVMNRAVPDRDYLLEVLNYAANDFAHFGTERGSRLPWLSAALLCASPEHIIALAELIPDARMLRAAPTSSLAELLAQISRLLDDETIERLAPKYFDEFGSDGREPLIWIFLANATNATTPTRRKFATDSLRKRLQTVARNSSAYIDTRAQAIAALGIYPFPEVSTALLDLGRNGDAAEIRTAALNVLRGYSDARIATALLEGLDAVSPSEQQARLGVLLNRTPFTLLLLDEIAAGNLPATLIDLATQKRLTTHSDVELRDKAKAVFGAAASSDRLAVIERYRPALDVEGDAVVGRVLFQKQCSTCHKIGGEGTDVGPDISDSRTRSPIALLTDILHPNRAVDGRYVAYTVLTDEGLTETGLVTAETSDAVVLTQSGGKTKTVPRASIEQMKSSGQSLMPVGFEKNLTPEQMRDLIAYVKNWRYRE